MPQNIAEKIAELKLGEEFFLTIDGQNAEEVIFWGQTKDKNNIIVQSKGSKKEEFPVAHIEKIEKSW